MYNTHVSASLNGCGTRFAPSQKGKLYVVASFSDTSQGCALRRRRLRKGKDGEAAHINHMKLLPDIRARLPSWTGLSDQQCGAMRCDCDLMAVERWDQLTKARDAASAGLA